METKKKVKKEKKIIKDGDLYLFDFSTPIDEILSISPSSGSDWSPSTDTNTVPEEGTKEQQDAVFRGSDCVDSDFDALSAKCLLSAVCSLSALKVLSDCFLTAH